MAYDSTRHVIVLFGGIGDSGHLADTWGWDGTDWTDKTPVSGSPTPRRDTAMAFNSDRGVMVLFGGFGESEAQLNETWEWDGTNWTHRVTTDIPSGTMPAPPPNLIWQGFAPGEQFVLGIAGHTWGCDTIASVALGMCVAHGIPVRLVEGGDTSCQTDWIIEIFSTKFNKWILAWTQPGRWVEDADGIPQSLAEIRDHHAAGNYAIVDVGYELGINGYRAIAQNNSGLVFKPSPVWATSLFPNFSVKWWSDMLFTQPETRDFFTHNFTYPTEKLNNSTPSSSIVLYDDYSDIDNVCEYQDNSSFPIVPGGTTDENLTYPLNNVEASAVVIAPNKVHITLVNNMVAGTGLFDRYETSLDGGVSWQTLSLESEGGGVYNWYPTQAATLMIRGVNIAGVHSPDVVIRASVVWEWPG